MYLADGEWERVFTEKPPVFTKEEKQAWICSGIQMLLCGSDAFFPFSDNIERAFTKWCKIYCTAGWFRS